MDIHVSSYGTVSQFDGRVSWSKELTWADGSRETIEVTENGRIFVNGREVIAFGFHAKHGVPNPSDAIANAMLDRLKSDGVKFMTLNFAYWETYDQCRADIVFWMPKLYAHKMWVLLQPQWRESPPKLDASYQFDKWKMIIDYASSNDEWAKMVFAMTCSWEEDMAQFNFTNDQVEAYLSKLYPMVKNYLSSSRIGSVPLASKLVNSAPYFHGSTAVVKYCDIPGWDIYQRITADGRVDYAWLDLVVKRFHDQLLPSAGKTGRQVWFTEFGAWEGNQRFTAEVLQVVLRDNGYNDTGLAMMWVMWHHSSSEFAAFNPDGTPRQWYLDCVSYFPE